MLSDPRPGTVLECKGLNFAFGAQEILRGVDLGISAGEVVALTGPSGSGKSTLLHCLTGLLRPSGGSVRFQGEPLPRSARASSRLRLRSMGFVFQFGELLPELTVTENVELPLRLLGTSAADARERAAAVLDQIGIGHLADRPVAQVSGGEAQRAAVGRAIVHRPPLVVADEPTGSVDGATGALVLDALLDLADHAGAAVLLVTHDPVVAARASRRFELSAGILHRSARQA